MVSIAATQPYSVCSLEVDDELRAELASLSQRNGGLKTRAALRVQSFVLTGQALDLNALVAELEQDHAELHAAFDDAAVLELPL